MGGYSDCDLWVNTSDTVMTRSQRTQFAEAVFRELISNKFVSVEGLDYKPTATTFYTDECDFDINFSRSEWADSRRVISPSAEDFRRHLKQELR